jgi:hypothetical protein
MIMRLLDSNFHTAHPENLTVAHQPNYLVRPCGLRYLPLLASRAFSRWLNQLHSSSDVRHFVTLNPLVSIGISMFYLDHQWLAPLFRLGLVQQLISDISALERDKTVHQSASARPHSLV